MFLWRLLSKEEGSVLPYSCEVIEYDSEILVYFVCYHPSQIPAKINTILLSIKLDMFRGPVSNQIVFGLNIEIQGSSPFS